MKVLQICSKPPLPAIDGGCKAMNNITHGLFQNNINVKVLTIATHKHPFKREAFSEEYINQIAIKSVHVNTKVNLFAAFFNLFSSKSYNIERFYDKRFEELIVKTIQEDEFDIILLESLYVANYLTVIRKYSSAKIIYRAHNIESEIWERNANQELGLKNRYLKILAKKLRNYEQNTINLFDGIATISKKDKGVLQQMGCKIPIEVFPFGIDLSDYEIGKASTKKTIFHIGSMDWKPNQEGIKWFLDHVWNQVVAQFPGVEFVLAGKDMPDWLIHQHQKNVTIVGEVKDAIEFINQHAIMVVPLFAASGMRIKIIEGMALGKLVITTSIGAEGIAYTNNENIIIADTKEEFVTAIINMLKNNEESERIAKNGRELIESNYDNQLIVNNLVEFFKQIIK